MTDWPDLLHRIPQWFATPLQLDFMRDALLMAALIAIPSALLSCLVVLRGWALMGDAVAHAVLPGVALAYLFGLPVFIGAIAAGLACTLAIGYLQSHCRVREETLTGVVFSGMFALGLVLMVASGSGVHLEHILLGDLLGIAPADLWQSLAVALLVATVLLWRGRDLLLHAFDPVHAGSLGLPVRTLHYGLLVLLTLTIVSTLTTTGLVLTVALLIAPGAIALLWARTFTAMLVTAVAVSLTACLTGVYFSFFLDSAPAASIVVVFAALFVAAFATQSKS